MHRGFPYTVYCDMYIPSALLKRTACLSSYRASLLHACKKVVPREGTARKSTLVLSEEKCRLNSRTFLFLATSHAAPFLIRKPWRASPIFSCIHASSAAPVPANKRERKLDKGGKGWCHGKTFLSSRSWDITREESWLPWHSYSSIRLAVPCKCSLKGGGGGGNT